MAFSLIAAACGSDSGDASDDVDSSTTEAGSETEATTNDDEQTSDNNEPGDDTDTTETGPAEAGTIEELEADWEADRTAIVDELTAGIEAGDIGVGDDGILRGPGGFEVDLGDCPGDWSDTAGTDEAEVRIGQSLVQSGPAAVAGTIKIGMQLYFDHVNSLGGIGGRDVILTSLDDEYVATKTIENVDQLIQNEDPFLLHLAGSPNVLATYDQINAKCIPNPMVATGHPAWGDPINHPWTTGGLFSYGTEAVMWGNWIKDNVGELPVVVGGAFIDNDFGLALELGFQEWADENPDVVSEFVPVRFDPAAPTVVNEMTTIADADPQVLVIGTTGVTCSQTIVEADRSGMKDTLVGAFTTSVCKPIEANIAPAGVSADEWLVVGGGIKDTTDPNHTDETFIAWLNNFTAEQGEDPSLSFIGTGYFFAWPIIEALRIADALPGGLTRSNFILAHRSVKLDHPMLLDGVEFEVNGAEDAYYIEGADISRFDADAQSWNVEGAIVDINGSTLNCAWNNDEGGCE